MSKTIDYRLITRPHLCDIVKADWASDTLPDDGKQLSRVGNSVVPILNFSPEKCLYTTIERAAGMPLPDTVSPPPEDNDDLQEETEALEKQSNKWHDLGLSQLQS